MARIDTLTNFLTDVASAIKQKKGDSTNILASDFDTEITNLPSGGGNVAHPDFVSFANYQGTTLDISWLRTDNITSMVNMFNYCQYLTSIDVSKFDTTNVTSMMSMFNTCRAFTSIDVSNFKGDNLTDVSSMFASCSNLTNITLNGFDTSKVANASYMFSGCSNIVNMDLSVLDLSSLTNLAGMFNNCSKLENVDLSSATNTKITSLGNLFQNCTKLTTFKIPIIDNANVSCSFSNMFYGCSSLVNADLTNIKTTNTRYVGQMFYNCSNLHSVDLSNFYSPSSMINAGSMFYGCTSLTRIDMRSFDFSNIGSTSSSYYNNMFGSSASNGVPNGCLIIVKDDTSKSWITNKFPRLTNVKTVAEL